MFLSSQAAAQRVATDLAKIQLTKETTTKDPLDVSRRSRCSRTSKRSATLSKQSSKQSVRNEKKAYHEESHSYQSQVRGYIQ